MSSIKASVSSMRRQEVEKQTENAMNEQIEKFNKRVEANAEYAKMATEKILKEFSKDLKETNAKLSSTTELYCKPEPEFLVAIQIRSQVNIAPRPKKTLSLLRLKQINNCVILRNNLSIRNMLQNAKDYIAYGTISYELLRTLIYTRGMGKINGSKVKLTNENIETAFEGKFKCVEELCNVIYQGKPEIKEVLRFLCPHKLCPPRGGFPNGHKKKPFIKGGSSNDHKHLLGDLLENMI